MFLLEHGNHVNFWWSVRTIHKKNLAVREVVFRVQRKRRVFFTIYFVVDISGPIKVMITNATTFVILGNLMDEACLGMIEWLSIALHIAVYLYFL